MSLPSPDLPERPRAAPWRAPRLADAAGHGLYGPLLRGGAAVLGGLAALLVLAAWAIPPLLDWGRFRASIASIAAAELGRKVTIGGEVTLRLLPEAVLTASDVTLPDQGDGISVEIGALRLQVALRPLLAGKIVPRDLVLGTPVLRLPWPVSARLADSMAHPARPHVPHAFAAHMENGTLRVGRAEVTGIDAAIHGGPDSSPPTGSLPQDPGADGFGAEGFAAFGGRTWRFTSALGAPDADGVSAVDLSIGGQGEAAKTNAKLRGTLAEGVVQGRLEAGGPDLSLLMPAAQLAWRVEAPFVADGDRVEARSVSLSLGGAPAEGSFVVRLSAPRLDGHIEATSLDLDGWARILRDPMFDERDGRFELARLPGRVSWSAGAARLLGGKLLDLHGTLVSDGTTLRMEEAKAVLPGAARLEMSGVIGAGSRGLSLTGPARLDAPDAQTTLAWLRPLMPSLVDDILVHPIPDGVASRPVATRAELAGTVSLDRGALSVADLSGQIDVMHVAGKVGTIFGQHPRLEANVTLDRPPLDAWLGTVPPMTASTLAALGARFSHVESDIHLHAAAASWHGQAVSNLLLDAHSGGSGLSVDRATARLSGADLAASVAISPDGAVSDGRVSASSAELAGLHGVLPANWRWLGGLLHGPGLVTASASGPADDVDAALRAEAGDAVLEAEWRYDPGARTASGNLTFRHPGAPRLLAALGVSGAAQWLDSGSLAIRSEFSTRPGLVSIEAFDLSAAELRLSGHLTMTYGTAARPLMAGEVLSDMLTLPASWTAAELPVWPRGWDARLGLAASHVTLDRMAVAGPATAAIDLSGGVGVVQMRASDIAGGSFTGEIAFDAGAALPTLAVQGRLANADLGGLVLAAPLGIAAGRADVDLDLLTTGRDPQAWRGGLTGEVRATVRDLDATGFDLARMGTHAASHGRAARAALLAAVTTGTTDGLSGAVSMAWASGRMSLTPATLTCETGDVSLSGSADLVSRNGDLMLGLAQGVGLRVSGPFGRWMITPQLAAQTGKTLLPLKKKKKKDFSR